MLEVRKIYKIGIYLVDSGNEFTGIGEVEKFVGIGLADRAQMLYDKYAIKLYYMVSSQMVGYYGNRVQYIVVNKGLKILVNRDFTHLFSKLVLPKFDLVHILHQNPKFHQRLGKNMLVTIHDINFVHNNNCSKNAMNRKVKRTRRILRIATHLSFISNFSSSDVMEHFPFTLPSRVVMNGVSDLSSEKQEIIYDLPQNFFLHLSDLGEKKNAQLLVKMMKFLPNENLVLAGGACDADMKRLSDIIISDGLKNVYMIGRVSREQKAYIFDKCKAFLFPSRSEGFGLPILEAMCFGKPTFISNLTSLPEVGVDIAYYYNELEPEQMAEVTCQGIKSFYSKSESNIERAKTHATSFTWDKAVDGYIKYYFDILGIEK